MAFDPERFGAAMKDSIQRAVKPLEDEIARLREAIADIKAPADGKDGRDGKDGSGVAGAMIDRGGCLVLTLTNGETKSLGVVVGADGKSGVDGTNGKDGRDGKDGTNGQDGRDGIGLDDFEIRYLPESHEIEIKASCANRTKSLRYPAGGIRLAGYWREGNSAKAAEAWSCGGALWIAKCDTTSKPADENDAWVLAARAGRDGERGARGRDATPDAPINLKVPK
jgi:hypothetical protein